MGYYLRVGTDIVNHSISSKFRLIVIVLSLNHTFTPPHLKVVAEGKMIHGHMVGQMITSY